MHHSKIKQPRTSGAARVPFIMQMEALECGAAALAMVLAYYEKWVPLEEVRVRCGVSRDGSNAKNILLAARSYGFQCDGYRYETETLRTSASFPCIIHWNFNHFVVLCGFRGKSAVINDPAKGVYTVDMETFDASFTGICLTLRPTEGFAPSGRKKSVLQYVRKRLLGAETLLIFGVLCSMALALVGILLPGFSRVFLDRILTNENPDWFVPFLLLLTALSLLRVLLMGVEVLFHTRVNIKMAAGGGTSFLWKILHLPMEFFSQRMAGDIQERQNANAQITAQVLDTLVPLFFSCITMLFYLVVMLRYSTLLTAIGVSSVILNFVLMRIISKKRLNQTRVQMHARAKFSSACVAGIEMIETIKASGSENGFFSTWTGYQATVATQQTKHAKTTFFLQTLCALISSVSHSAILLLGVYLSMNGQFTVGMIMAFQGFLSAFAEPALSFVSADQALQESMASMERVEDVMDYPDDEYCAVSSVEDEQAAPRRKLMGRVELRDVSFGYSRLSPPLIQNFSMTLEPGKRVALVGPSGCGKSTVAKLVSGLYQPWCGEILFDGKPRSAIDRGSFTGSVAVVDQDVILFEDTIANNIKMWDESIEDFEMILAARDAKIHDVIIRRPNGYQYMLSEGAKDLSGGERQRLEIARVLAQDPTLVILDEATSALDARTEAEVISAINDRGVSCIIIAHRFSTIRDCDEIIVLDHGIVVERGTHAELMALNGRYAQLARSESSN